jgi:RNA polymerase sigma-70 factor (ECF subfamily)
MDASLSHLYLDSHLPLDLIPMETSASTELSVLLVRWSEGDESALVSLLPHIERELHRIAHHYMRRENVGHTLQTTALVNEAYLKLIDQKVRWQNRSHFFAIAAQIMRRILLDHAKSQHRIKRGGEVTHIALSESGGQAYHQSAELLALNDALNTLAEFDLEKSKIVEMRYFGGLTVEEVAQVMEISPVTVARHWRVAKAWLRREISR